MERWRDRRREEKGRTEREKAGSEGGKDYIILYIAAGNRIQSVNV